MNNVVLILKFKENISENLKRQKILSSMNIEIEDKIDSDKTFKYKNLIFEVVYHEEKTIIINILGAVEELNDYVKLSLDSNEFEATLAFNSISNEKSKEHYQLLHDIETLTRTLIYTCIKEKYLYKTTDVLKKIKHREAINIDSNIRNRVFFLFEQISFMDLIEFINMYPQGGEELKRIEDFYLNNYKNELEETEIDILISQLKELINEDIFKEINKVFKANDKLKFFRNVICHNIYYDINGFENEIVQDVKKILEALKKIATGKNLPLTDNKIVIDVYKENYDFEEKNNLIEFYKFIMSFNIIPNSEKIGIIENIYTYKNGVDDLELKLEFLNDSSENILTFEIIIPENYRINQEFNESFNLLLKGFETDKILILDDCISKKKLINLYEKYNYIENTLRMYLSILDCKENKMEENVSISNTKGAYKGLIFQNKNVNKFYGLNFIDIKEVISNPNANTKFKDIKTKLNSVITSKKLEEISDVLIGLKLDNEALDDIMENWKKLYKFRTIIAHCGIIREEEFIAANEIASKYIKAAEKALIRLLKNNFNYIPLKNISGNLIDGKIKYFFNKERLEVKITGEEKEYILEELSFFSLIRLCNCINNDYYSHNVSFFTETIDKVISLENKKSLKIESLLSEKSLKRLNLEKDYEEVIITNKTILENKIDILLHEIELKLKK